MMGNVNCLRCRFRHEDNGNCTAVGGFCTAVPAAHCPLLREYLDTRLEPEAVETVKLALAAKHMVDLETLNNTPISRLVELAEADKAGRCVVLPCKVGDTAYYLNRPVILDFEVIGYMVDERGAWSFMGEHLDKTTGDTYSCCPDTEKVGKTVFLTREEAERAMQEMEGRKDGV